MADGTLSLALYRQGLALLTPLAPLVLWQRARAGKELPARLGERRGVASRKRPAGPLIWLHGASVGEVVSLAPLAAALSTRDFAVLVTSGTKTSAIVAAERLPPEVIHQFVPLDIPRYVDRFLKHWRPSLALFAESELWPNLLAATNRAGAPIVVVNGRMSDRSFARWERRKKSAAALFRNIDEFLVQSPREVERFRDLGAERVFATGNLKFDVPPPPVNGGRLAQLTEAIRGRPVALAASLHPGEDRTVAQAHAFARRELPDLLTVVAPRHPDRGPAMQETFAAAGLKTGRRSQNVLPDDDLDVYIADTIGELGLFFRVAGAVFMGGSLVARGGQNPIEAAKLGRAVIHGPHVENFTDIYTMLDRAGGAVPVRDGEALGHALAVILSDSGIADTMGQAALAAVGQLGGALPRTLEALEPYLIQLRLG